MHSYVWLKLDGGGILYSFLEFFPGVPLFFMVSGFLITDSFLNSKNIKQYFIKRGLRIYPALFVNILILELAMYIGGNMFENNFLLFSYIEYFITYVFTASMGIAKVLFDLQGVVHTVDSGFFQSYPSGVLWTLTVELSFYVILSIVFFIKNSKIRNIFLLSLILLAIAISSQATKDFYELNKITMLLHISVLPYIWIFSIGIVFRLYWDKIKKFFIGYGAYYFIFYILYSIVKVYYIGDTGSYKIGLTALTVLQTIFLASAMFSMAFSHTHIKFNRKIDLSYSTYLYHMLFVQIFISLGFVSEWKYFFIIVGLTLFTAYLSWTYIEKPMLNFKVKKI
jgi:peptidoglycan/LPS O-acetylase OafA/YrhL